MARASGARRGRRFGIAALGAAIAVAVVAPTPSLAAPLRSAPATTARAHVFAVGSRTEAFVDTTRPTPANGAYPGGQTRALPTLILYPAVGKPGGVDHPNAAAASGPFPLVVFSHGTDSNGAVYEPLLRQWAEAGYVVAAPTFPLSNHNAPGGNTITDYVHQPGDVSFVITAMLRLNRDRASHFRGEIDANRVAVAGHSLGAITTLGVAVNSCCADPRIRAVVSIAGIELPFENGMFFTGRALPLLLLHGDADGTVPYASSQKVFADAPAPKYFITLHGAPHTSFRQAATASRPAPPWEPVVVASVTDFLDRYLKGDKAAPGRLTRDATVTGVASIQTG